MRTILAMMMTAALSTPVLACEAGKTCPAPGQPKDEFDKKVHDHGKKPRPAKLKPPPECAACHSGR